MTKAPTRRRTAARTRQPPGPRNQSRAAGAPAPESAAATRPMYDPPGEGDSRQFAADNGLAAAAAAAEPRPSEERMREHARFVAAGAIQADTGATMDLHVAKQLLNIVDQMDPKDRAEYLRDVQRVRSLKRTGASQTQKLALPPRPGYHTHWFNDEGGRIDDALNNGWTARLDREKRPLRRAVGTGRDKGVLYAVAMDIPEMFWLEDMAARHEVAKARMDALTAQPFMARKGQATAADKGKFYDPTETGVLTIEKTNPTTPL